MARVGQREANRVPLWSSTVSRAATPTRAFGASNCDPACRMAEEGVGRTAERNQLSGRQECLPGGA
jgi:hypothetical protein